MSVALAKALDYGQQGVRGHAEPPAVAPGKRTKVERLQAISAGRPAAAPKKGPPRAKNPGPVDLESAANGKGPHAGDGCFAPTARDADVLTEVCPISGRVLLRQSEARKYQGKEVSMDGDARITLSGITVTDADFSDALDAPFAFTVLYTFRNEATQERLVKAQSFLRGAGEGTTRPVQKASTAKAPAPKQTGQTKESTPTEKSKTARGSKSAKKVTAARDSASPRRKTAPTPQNSNSSPEKPAHGSQNTAASPATAQLDIKLPEQELVCGVGDNPEAQLQRAHTRLDLLVGVGLPLFRAAVDCLNAGAARTVAEICLGLVAAAQMHLETAAEMNVDPFDATVSDGTNANSEASMPASPEEGQYEQDSARVDAARQRYDSVARRALQQMSVQIFRGAAVLGRLDYVPPYEQLAGAVNNEASKVIGLIEQANRICALVGNDPKKVDKAVRREAVQLAQNVRGRPADFAFLRRILVQQGIWDALASERGHFEGGLTGKPAMTLKDTHAMVQDHAREFGSFVDVGSWDEKLAGIHHGAANRKEIFGMLRSADKAGCAKLVHKLHAMGMLVDACDSVGWQYVKQLEQSIDDREAVMLLNQARAGRSGGKSLTQLINGKAKGLGRDGNHKSAAGLMLVNDVLDMATFGFKPTHDGAYKDREDGLSSDDDYHGVTARALARTAAVMGASMATGAVAGMAGRGMATGLRLNNPIVANGIAGGFGGAVGGVADQVVADVADMVLFDKEGFSGVGDYVAQAKFGGLVGGVLGAAGGSVEHVRNKTAEAKLKKKKPPLLSKKVPLLDRSANKIMNRSSKLGERMGPGGTKEALGWRGSAGSYASRSSWIARKFPTLDNSATKLRNGAARLGFRARVRLDKQPDIAPSDGPTTTTSGPTARERIALVDANTRIDVESRTMTRIESRAKLEEFMTTLDSETGMANLKPGGTPRTKGFVADTENIAPQARASNDAIRQELGLEGKHEWYEPYENATELYEVTFRTKVELDVPPTPKLKKGTPTGGMDDAREANSGAGLGDLIGTNHRPGTGLTNGGVPEGVIPSPVPVEVLDICRIGDGKSVLSNGPVGTAEYLDYVRESMSSGVAARGGLLSRSRWLSDKDLEEPATEEYLYPMSSEDNL